MDLPKLSALQFAILSLLKDDDEMPGQDLRALLEKEFSHSRSLASFYQVMARLEENGLVVGHYSAKMVKKQRVREKLYQRTACGQASIADTLAFYQKVSQAFSIRA